MGSDYKNDNITVCEAIAKPFTPPGDRYGLALTLCSFPRDDQTDMDVDKVTKLLCSMRMALRVAWEVWEPCKMHWEATAEHPSVPCSGDAACGPWTLTGDHVFYWTWGFSAKAAAAPTRGISSPA